MVLRLIAAASMIVTVASAASATGAAQGRPSDRTVVGSVHLTSRPAAGSLEKVIATKSPTDQLVVPVDPRTGESLATGRIVVKFRDDLGVRAPRSPVPFPTSLGGAPLAAIDAILAGNNATISQWINRTPDELAAITARAEVLSGRPQPDLASIFFVDPPKDRLAQTAQALNDLGIVDWVSIDRKLVTHQQGCDATNAVICNQPNPSCAPTFTDCNPDPGDMMQMAQYGCADVACCELVASILPECDDSNSPRGWDAYCAALANALCPGTIYDSQNPTLAPGDRYDPCLLRPGGVATSVLQPYANLIQNGCFDVSPTRGCSDGTCCSAVCIVDPLCCVLGWDATCVSLAGSLASCGLPPVVAETPDFSGFVEVVCAPSETALPCSPGELDQPRARGRQTYTVGAPVVGLSLPFAQIQQIQGNPGLEFLQTGFRGGGFDLQRLREIGIEYAEVYQNGGQPILNGRTINVGVIEFAAYVNHEDFLLATPANPDGTGGVRLETPRVILERGQTPVLVPENDPDHGTATLGMIVAANNGFGVTGIAHEAQGWFFPTVSVEEGGRLQNAMISAISAFEPGDILNFSIGFGGGFTVASIPQYYQLLRLASDVGITSFMSAGNDCTTVQPEAGPVPSDAIVVGAAWPGAQTNPIFPGVEYCRLPFSNWYDPTEDDPLARVHCSGWGTAVTTLGYGDLFNGRTSVGTPQLEENELRTYTSIYGGTSAASPMVAGLGAVMQGFAKQVFGMPVAPSDLKRLFELNGSQQCSIPYVTPGFPGNDEFPCGGDNLVGEGAGIIHAIGRFPSAVDIAIQLLRQDWPSNVTGYRVYTGVEITPRSPFRLRRADDISVEIESRRTRPGSRVAGLLYLAGGWTTDIEIDTVYLDDPTEPIEIVGLAVDSMAAASADNVFRLVYAFNWRTKRWTLLDVAEGGAGYFLDQTLPEIPPGDTFVLNPFEDARDYIIEATGQVRVRIWTCGLGAVPNHSVFHDFVSSRPNQFVPTGN